MPNARVEKSCGVEDDLPKLCVECWLKLSQSENGIYLKISLENDEEDRYDRQWSALFKSSDQLSYVIASMRMFLQTQSAGALRIYKCPERKTP